MDISMGYNSNVLFRPEKYFAFAVTFWAQKVWVGRAGKVSMQIILISYLVEL